MEVPRIITNKSNFSSQVLAINCLLLPLSGPAVPSAEGPGDELDGP